jgi:hypothetical protein
MPAFLTSLGAKIGAYALVALLVFSGGFYAGRRWELADVQTAKLALASQQAADAQAYAKGNAIAATEISQDAAAGNAAQATKQTRSQAAQAAAANIRTSIAAQAAQPGQDGPLAPVLAATAAAEKALQQGAQP